VIFHTWTKGNVFEDLRTDSDGGYWAPAMRDDGVEVAAWGKTPAEAQQRVGLVTGRLNDAAEGARRDHAAKACEEAE